MAYLPSERNKNNGENKGIMDEMEVVLRKFGDEQSTLLDKFERLSFEVQLNQAILSRSLSEPTTVPCSNSKSLARPPPTTEPPPPVPVLRPLMNTQVRQGRRGGSGFSKFLKKMLLKPIVGLKGTSHHHNNNKNNNGGRKVKAEVTDPKNPKFYKAFSKSLRF